MISATILTKNSAKYLQQVLSALKPFDEVVILDNGSSDLTLEIARQFANTRIYTSPFIGFGPLHNLAASYAKNDWILSIDSDEVISELLTQEILQETLNRNTIYSFPRHTYYRGKLIKWCGWYPDRIIRLYHRKMTRFSDDLVHEKILQNSLQEKPFQHPLIHYSYASIADFLTKMQSYSELFAKQQLDKRSSSVSKAITHSLFAFFKSYFLKRGFLGGYEGFLISVYNSHTALYKYLKLYEASLDHQKITHH